MKISVFTTPGHTCALTKKKKKKVNYDIKNKILLASRTLKIRHVAFGEC